MKKHLTILFLLFVSISFAQNERRIALVIGNAEYLGKGCSLRNPAHDAEDVSAKLKTLGFDVTTLIDGSLLQMKDAVNIFSSKSKDYNIAFFYYSGHGLQTKGNNYMMPVDAEPNTAADVEYECYPLNRLLDKLDESNCPMKIIVLDACRNNPFTKGWHRGNAEEGLASVQSPKGTFITFATAAGSVAYDGTGRNSPYTSAFLQTLDTPNLSLFEFFNTVGLLVLEETHNKQDPWVNYSTMKGSFCFNKTVTPAPSVVKATTTTQPTGTRTELSAEQNYETGLDYYNKSQYSNALGYFRKAAEQGYAAGQSDLGFMYYNGYGVTKDYDEAVKWFRKAAEQGLARGQNNLGNMYRYGYGVTKDYDEAVKWYRKAAEQGLAQGQCSLGFMYYKGYGVTKDYAEAVKWYRKAAEQGLARGQYNLGYMYQYGYGVKKDQSKALEWYRKAAEQGDEDAKAKVAELSR